MPKRLQQTSKYAKYDLDGDGEVTDEELERHQQLVELELREEKADSQRNMAWVAMISMVMFSIFLMLPMMPDSRVKALSDLLGLFYIAQASIVAAYFGATAFMLTNIEGAFSPLLAIQIAAFLMTLVSC